MANPNEISLFVDPVHAGFPSPAADDIERKLDLNDYLIEHPSATFFVRVQGDSMIGAGIHEGDILIVDRALTPGDGKVVIAVVNGEFTVKRLLLKDGRKILMPENPRFTPIKIEEGSDCQIWGVVTYAIHKLCTHRL